MAKAKAALRLCSDACNTNQYCLWGSRSSVAKTGTQGQPMKNPQVKESKKPQELKALAF